MLPGLDRLLPLPAGVKPIVGVDPAANNEATITVPAGKAWGLFSVSISLAQGLTQTPQPTLFIDDGTTVFEDILGSSAVQAVSTTCKYTWAPGMTQSGQIGAGAAVHSYAPLPDGLVLPAGSRVRTSTAGIGANSDYAAFVLYVVEYGI